MEEIKNYLEKRIAHAQKRYDEVRHYSSETHTFHGGQTLGYWQGKLSAYKNILDEIEATKED